MMEELDSSLKELDQAKIITIPCRALIWAIQTIISMITQ